GAGAVGGAVDARVLDRRMERAGHSRIGARDRTPELMIAGSPVLIGRSETDPFCSVRPEQPVSHGTSRRMSAGVLACPGRATFRVAAATCRPFGCSASPAVDGRGD